MFFCSHLIVPSLPGNKVFIFFPANDDTPRLLNQTGLLTIYDTWKILRYPAERHHLLGLHSFRSNPEPATCGPPFLLRQVLKRPVCVFVPEFDTHHSPCHNPILHLRDCFRVDTKTPFFSRFCCFNMVYDGAFSFLASTKLLPPFKRYSGISWTDVCPLLSQYPSHVVCE